MHVWRCLAYGTSRIAPALAVQASLGGSGGRLVVRRTVGDVLFGFDDPVERLVRPSPESCV